MDDSASVAPSYNGVKTEQRYFTEAAYGSSRIRRKTRPSLFLGLRRSRGDPAGRNVGSGASFLKLSRRGCYIDALEPILPVGPEQQLRISDGLSVYDLRAKVIYMHSGHGTGNLWNGHASRRGCCRTAVHDGIVVGGTCTPAGPVRFGHGEFRILTDRDFAN